MGVGIATTLLGVLSAQIKLYFRKGIAVSLRAVMDIFTKTTVAQVRRNINLAITRLHF